MASVSDLQADTYHWFLKNLFPETFDMEILKRMLYNWWLRLWINREKDLLNNTSKFKAQVELDTHEKRWKYYTEWHNPEYIGFRPPAVEMEQYHKLQRELKSLKYELNLYTDGSK